MDDGSIVLLVSLHWLEPFRVQVLRNAVPSLRGLPLVTASSTPSSLTSDRDGGDLLITGVSKEARAIGVSERTTIRALTDAFPCVKVLKTHSHKHTLLQPPHDQAEAAGLGLVRRDSISTSWHITPQAISSARSTVCALLRGFCPPAGKLWVENEGEAGREQPAAAGAGAERCDVFLQPPEDWLLRMAGSLRDAPSRSSRGGGASSDSNNNNNNTNSGGSSSSHNSGGANCRRRTEPILDNGDKSKQEEETPRHCARLARLEALMEGGASLARVMQTTLNDTLGYDCGVVVARTPLLARMASERHLCELRRSLQSHSGHGSPHQQERQQQQQERGQEQQQQQDRVVIVRPCEELSVVQSYVRREGRSLLLAHPHKPQELVIQQQKSYVGPLLEGEEESAGTSACSSGSGGRKRKRPDDDSRDREGSSSLALHLRFAEEEEEEEDGGVRKRADAKARNSGRMREESREASGDETTTTTSSRSGSGSRRRRGGSGRMACVKGGSSKVVPLSGSGTVEELLDAAIGASLAALFPSPWPLTAAAADAAAEGGEEGETAAAASSSAASRKGGKTSLLPPPLVGLSLALQERKAVERQCGMGKGEQEEEEELPEERTGVGHGVKKRVDLRRSCREEEEEEEEEEEGEEGEEDTVSARQGTPTPKQKSHGEASEALPPAATAAAAAAAAAVSPTAAAPARLETPPPPAGANRRSGCAAAGGGGGGGGGRLPSRGVRPRLKCRVCKAMLLQGAEWDEHQRTHDAAADESEAPTQQRCMGQGKQQQQQRQQQQQQQRVIRQQQEESWPGAVGSRLDQGEEDKEEQEEEEQVVEEEEEEEEEGKEEPAPSGASLRPPLPDGGGAVRLSHLLPDVLSEEGASLFVQSCAPAKRYVARFSQLLSADQGGGGGEPAAAAASSSQGVAP